MDYTIKDVSTLINDINRVREAAIEVEISKSGVCNGSLTSGESIKIKITPPPAKTTEV